MANTVLSCFTIVFSFGKWTSTFGKLFDLLRVNNETLLSDELPKLDTYNVHDVTKLAARQGAG